MDQAVKSEAAPPRWRKRKRIAMEMRQVLFELFPKAFMGFSRPKVPLKIGIKDDIFKAAPDLPRSRVRLAIQDYVHGKTYHRSARPGVMRIDLEGNPCGSVTNDEAGFHAQWLKKILTARSKRQRAAKKAKKQKKAENAIPNT